MIPIFVIIILSVAFSITIFKTHGKYKAVKKRADEYETLNSDLDEVNKKIIKASAEQTQLISQMVYETKSILSNTKSHYDAFDELELEESYRSPIVQTKSLQKSAGKILNKIMKLIKAGHGNIIIQEKPFDLRRLTREIAQFYEVLAKEKNLNFHFNMAPKTPRFVKGDSIKLQEILTNLLSNAYKYTGTGSIKFNVKSRKKTEDLIELNFEIIDTGAGIEKSRLDELFINPSNKTTAGDRSCFGLIITKRLIEMMNGIINVESVLNQGSNFSFNMLLKVSDKLEDEEETIEEPEKNKISGNIQNAGLINKTELFDDEYDFLIKEDFTKALMTQDQKNIDFFIKNYPAQIRALERYYQQKDFKNLIIKFEYLTKDIKFLNLSIDEVDKEIKKFINLAKRSPNEEELDGKLESLKKILDLFIERIKQDYISSKHIIPLSK